MGVESYGGRCGGGSAVVPAAGLPREEFPRVKADRRRCGDHDCSSVSEARWPHVSRSGVGLVGSTVSTAVPIMWSQTRVLR